MGQFARGVPGGVPGGVQGGVLPQKVLEIALLANQSLLIKSFLASKLLTLKLFTDYIANKMDISELITPPRTPGRPRTIPPPSPPHTPTQRRFRNRETTRSDRIRIRTALEWATPRKVFEKYRYTKGYTLQQIRDTRNLPLTLQKSKTGRHPAISAARCAQLRSWLLAEPRNRHIPYRYIARFAPQFL